MRYETKTVRIGENTGPIDWSYDFRSHFDCMGASDEAKDATCEQKTRWLRRIEADVRDGVPVRVTNYGGWPRVGIYPVLEVGMYDGWPYWRPVPSVCVATRLGTEWYSFSAITDVYAGSPDGAALDIALAR